MAKRKKVTKRPTRRRRVSGVGSDFMKEAVGALGGYVVAKMLAQKIMPNLDDKIKGAALAGIGVLVIPKMISGALGKGLSIGLVVGGGDLVLRSAGIISGIEDMMYVPYQINGAGIDQSVNGMGNNGINQMVAGAGINTSINGVGNHAKTMQRQRAES